MKLENIPIGHIAQSVQSPRLYVLRGKHHGIHIAGYSVGFSSIIEEFEDDYIDVGKIKVDVEEIKTYKVNISVE